MVERKLIRHALGAVVLDLGPGRLVARGIVGALLWLPLIHGAALEPNSRTRKMRCSTTGDTSNAQKYRYCFIHTVAGENVLNAMASGYHEMRY